LLKKIIYGSMLAVLILGTIVLLFNIQPAKAHEIFCDINNDGKVDLKDVAQAALAFGSYSGHPRWDPETDINGDNLIDIKDLAIIAKHFGETADIAVITVIVGIHPETLNLISKGRWITVCIELPEGYNLNDINVSTIMLNDTIPAESKPIAMGNCDGNGRLDLMIKFKRQEVIGLILRNRQFTNKFGTLTLAITGKLKDGRLFKGSENIKTILHIARECTNKYSWYNSYSRLLYCT